MSEDKSRFKIRKGEIEIEYEGKSVDVNTRYKEVFEWIQEVTTAPPKPTPSKKPETKTEKKPKEKKPEKRGGRRTSVISPAIDGLVEEGFLDDFKNASQIIEELRRKTVPISGRPPVIMALNRRVPSKLDRIKDEQRHWVYRKKKSSSGG